MMKIILFGAAMMALSTAGCAADTDGADEAASGSVGSELVTLEYDVARADGIPTRPGPIEVDASYGYSWFVAYGDYIYVVDTGADGESVGVQWQLLTDTGTVYRQGICRSAVGSGNNESGVCNMDFPELSRLRLRQARCDGTTSDCSKLDSWHDWTAFKYGFNQ